MLLKRYWSKYKGFRYYKDDISILIHSLGRSKENTNLSDDERLNEASAMLKYLDAVKTVEYKENKLSQVLTPKDFKEIESITFYKYMDSDIINQFILKGTFQFGSIEYYRETENENIKDKLEGSTYLVLIDSGREVFYLLQSGFNFNIFCGTNRSDSDELMTNQFGRGLIKIQNINSFARAVCKAIGARNYYLYHVQYSNQKAYKVETKIPNINSFSPDLDEEMFDCLYKHSFLPSLFVKPKRFENENELRLVFEMQHDVKKYLRITNKGLLDHIEIVH